MNCVKDRRSNNCRYVADAASIRVNAGSIGYDFPTVIDAPIRMAVQASVSLT